MYRDFITVGLLVRPAAGHRDQTARPLKDNWIYIQEPDVLGGPPADLQQLEPLHGRPTHAKVWIGLEYFC